MPGCEARASVAGGLDSGAGVWLRRLFTDPSGRDLVGMDSTRRDGWHVLVAATGLDGTGPHGIRIQTPTGRVHDSTAPPILGEGWAAPPGEEPPEREEDVGERFADWVEHAHEGHFWAA